MCSSDLLKNLAKIARKEEEEAARAKSSKETPARKCHHGADANDNISEKWRSEAENEALRFAISLGIRNAGTYRDFRSLAEFFDANPSYCTNDFAAVAFGYAATLILEKKVGPAEKIANLGLVAELYAERGYDEVRDAAKRMEDPKRPKMEPYLRKLHVEMRKTNASSSITRLLQKKIPCECLDDMKIGRAHV